MRVDLPVLRIKASFLAELKWLARDPRNPVYWIDFLKAERALKIELLENPAQQRGIGAESLWDKHISNDTEIRAIFSYVHARAAMYSSLSLSADKPSILISVLQQKEVKMLATEQDMVAAIYTHFEQLQKEEELSAGNERRDRFQPKANDDGEETSSFDEQALGSDAGCSGVSDGDGKDSEEEERGVAGLLAVAGLFRTFADRNASEICYSVDEKLVEHFNNGRNSLS